MSDALVGLLGVVIGGLLSAGTAYLASVRGERRQRLSKQRTTARLVEVELGQVAITISVLRLGFDEKLRREHSAKDIDQTLQAHRERQELGRYLTWAIENGQLPELKTTLWETHMGELADFLDFEAWDAVRSAYEESINRVRRVEQMIREHGQLPDRDPGITVADLERVSSAVLRAREALQRPARR